MTWPLIRPALGIALLLVLRVAQDEVRAAELTGKPRAYLFQATIPDSADVLKSARSAQARFERRRRSILPWTRAETGQPCDNRVGRFCQWFDGEHGWEPVQDPPELVRMRQNLLDELSEGSARIPGDRWILGQRVFYLSEAGRWNEAAELAGACGSPSRGWCDVLSGFALHGAGEYGLAMAAFRRGLTGMNSEEAREMRYPEVLFDRRAMALMGDADDAELEALRTRFWLLADPLYLMPGNDRETEHYARWTYSRMSEDARNPRGLRWGSDLEELTIRYGWDRGWERRRPNPGSPFQDAVTVGHDLPGTRGFVLSGRVLEQPWQTGPAAWLPSEGPRSAHVAAYAPVLDPGVGQVAVFHRGDSILVAAATRLPDLIDPAAVRRLAGKTPSDERRDLLAWAQPELLDRPDQIGLFLIDSENRLREVRSRGESEGVIAVSVAAGRYFMSLEAWAPKEGRAGRVRHGIVADTIPEDLVTLSDLIVLEPIDSPPQHLGHALPSMRRSLELTAGQRLAVGWEIFGLGWRQERVDFELSLSQEGGGFFGTIGRWLGLGGGGDEPLQVGWSEPGPDETGPWFRSMNVDVPQLEPGEYLLRLEVTIPGREPLAATRIVQISR